MPTTRSPTCLSRTLSIWSSSSSLATTIQRSIPSAIDGLKPSQRKVLFACFKRRLQDEIKVGQLAGYVSEHSAYHHGEQSLNMTIVGMAQDFVGVGWANLLEPIGQFGTRDRGGKDAASPRYIFTKLAPIARLMFPESDDGLLKTQTDDGLSIEPETYSPVVPVVLLNGADGIGTGWSTYVPPYDPLEVISNVRRMLDGDEMSSMHPSWRNFTGSVVEESPFVYIARGVAKVLANGDVEVTELPPGVWTQSFKEKIEKMVEDGTASSFENRSTDTNVHFLIKGLETTDPIATLKLEKRILTSNMHLFASDGKIKSSPLPAKSSGTSFSPVSISTCEGEPHSSRLRTSLPDLWMPRPDSFWPCAKVGLISDVPRRRSSTDWSNSIFPTTSLCSR